MLTHKQESFCQGVVSGKTQSDAYRGSYNVSNMTDKSVWEHASELRANGKVASRIRELQKKIEEKQLWTREMSVKALVAAYKEGSPNVKISAVKELNQMHGFNQPSKMEVSISQSKTIDEAKLSNETMEAILKAKDDNRS